MTKFTKKLTKIKEDCDKEVENDTSLTEEEKKELKKKSEEWKEYSAAVTNVLILEV